MNDKIETSIARDLGIVSRALSYLCLNSPMMAKAGTREQAKLLKTLGYDYNEIASFLDTTPKAISVRLAEAKRKPKKKVEKAGNGDKRTNKS